MKRFIGIDPGESGGIAWMFGGLPCAVKMPPTDRDICDLLQGFDIEYAIAAIEKVGPARGRNPDGTTRTQGVVSAFTFGGNFRALKMCMTCLEIPFREVSPAKWQKEFGLYGRKFATITEKKNAHKRVAQQLFPSLKITHATADALLIAEWMRRQESNSRKAGEG